MTDKTVAQPVRGLTQEALDILGAPVPDAEKKTRQGFGGKMLTYTSTEFVEDRASSVDLSWGDDCVFTETRIAHGVVGTVAYKLTVLGVTRSGSAGYFVPDDISYTDRDGNRKTRALTGDDVHTIVTAGVAKAKKRAAAEFTIARELWTDTNETRAAAASTGGGATNQSSGAQSSNGVPRDLVFASQKQKDMLFQHYMVPEDITALLTGGKEESQGGLPGAGQASQLYSTLKSEKARNPESYAANPNRYIKQALESINKDVAAKVLVNMGATTQANDEDFD